MERPGEDVLVTEPATILVVEDDPGVARLQRRHLERAGYEVATAHSADEAMDRISLGGLDAMLLDQGLPGTSGLEFYEILKANGYGDLPVVMVTGRSDEATIISALKAGMHDFVTKSPEYLEYLPEAVERVLHRVRVDQRLKESEERFRELVENLQVGVLLQGPAAEILLSNQAALDLLGLTEDQLLGKTSFDPDWGVVREDGSPFPGEEHPVPQAIATGRPVRDVVMGVHRPAMLDQVWLLVNAEPQFDDAGGVRQVICTFSDITYRKRAEEEIRRQADLLEQSHDAIFVWELGGPITYWNRGAEDLYGYPREDAIGRVSHELLQTRHPWSAAEFEATLLKQVRWEGELVHTTSDGREIVVESQHVAVRYGQGPTHVLETNRDITQRKRAEERLREAEARYRTMVERLPAATYVQDVKHDFSATFVSPQIETVLGYTPLECMSMPNFWAETIHPEDRDRVLAEEARTDETQEPFKMEYRAIRKDGRTVWIQNDAVLVRDEDGRALFWQGLVLDITERKRGEEELREARENAEAANRAKSEFLANMSHEIRTPMNGVIGMTELLLGTDLTEEQREFAETVRRSGDSLLSLIDSILDFSKIEAGAVVLEEIDFDLRSTVEDVAALLAERAFGKGIELASLIEYGVPTAVRGDPFRLRQILTNLLGNAIKFTERGEVVLRADVVEENEEELLVRFRVSDTGIGISEEQQKRLFSSFSQVDASTTRRFGGTGLGLAISGQLAELMGGEAGVESRLGEGSTFWFTVRLRKQAGVPAIPAPQGDLRGLRILIVDDNETNRRILCEQTAFWQARGLDAGSGPGAMAALHAAVARNDSYDVAIVDGQMPGMDGLELVRRIKSDPAISSTRLILLTSVGRRGQAREAMEAGAEAYLTKPVKQAELHDALAAVMNAPAPTTEPQEQPQLVTRHSLRESKARARARVLIAEDNMVNQKIAVRMVEKLGYRADVASDGREAVEALTRVPYAAVLMDVQMPEMDGHEAAAEIRRREATHPGARRTPIIAMTANAIKGDRELALEAGMDDYVSKPVKLDELAATLQSYIA